MTVSKLCHICCFLLFQEGYLLITYLFIEVREFFVNSLIANIPLNTQGQIGIRGKGGIQNGTWQTVQGKANWFLFVDLLGLPEVISTDIRRVDFLTNANRQAA